MSIEPRTVIGEVICPFCGSASEAMVGAQKGNRTVMACPRGCRGTAGAFPDRDLKQDYLDAMSETESENDEQDTLESENTREENHPEASTEETGGAYTGDTSSSIAGSAEPSGDGDAGARPEPSPDAAKPGKRGRWGSGSRI